MIGKDAFEFLSKQAVAADNRSFASSKEPDDVYFLRNADGSVSRVVGEPKPRKYTAARLDDFVTLINELREETGLLASTLVMIGEKKIEALLDEKVRRERIAFELTTTKAFETLEALEENRAAKAQKEFVSMLRVDLNDCIDPVIVAPFKQIKFEKNAEGESQISNSHKAVSTKIQMRVAAGGQDIPEEIEVKVRVYEEFPDVEMSVRCAVETNVEEATFTMIPLAGELHAASVETRNMIKERIVEELNKLAIAGLCAVHCGEINC